VSFLTSPAFGSFSRGLPSRGVLPDICALVVRLSTFLFGRFNFLFLNRRAADTVLIRSSNRIPFRQLRFAQARNVLELLNLVRNGFSSFLAAAFFIRIERCANIVRRTGESCLAETYAPVFEESNQSA
jgi:hypothetical protein